MGYEGRGRMAAGADGRAPASDIEGRGLITWLGTDPFMQSILDNALPFFALIFCGYGAGRLGVLDGTAAAGVNTFVFYFALPAFLFGLMSSSPIGEVVNAPFIGAYVTASLALFALSALVGLRLFEIGRAEAAVLGLAAVLANTGYMGIPLVSAVFGREAAVPIFAGLAVSATGLTPPTPLANFLDLLGGTAGPCALFALGATLAGRTVAGGAAEVSYMTFMKLALHPAALFFTTTVIFSVDPLWATAALLGAALPIAANVFIVARQYDVYVTRTSSAILVSTAVSMVSVSALLLVLQ